MTTAPFLLFDDAREGGTIRLYSDPFHIIEALDPAQVVPALARLREAVGTGAHAAGFLAYEAGYAMEPRLRALAETSGQPLLWFGLFHDFTEGDAAEMLGRGPPAAGAWVSRPKPRLEWRDYLEAAATVREHLFAGDFYQANFTFACDVAFQGDPRALYARLRSTSDAGWGGVVRHSNGWLLSLSPEQFFTLRDGLLEARPMKGTARRGCDWENDAVLIAQLASDPKQQAENLMIVDLLRNDLARVAEAGSVAVPELFTVETYPTLHQMTSRVTARLRPGLDALDVLQAIFPCGSVTGAPKISAMELLAQIEREPRGAYTGAMGWIAPDGDAAFNVLIRTLQINDGQGSARRGVGSALVVDSIAVDECRECFAKGEFVTRAAPQFDLFETMRFDPHEGVIELDRHLDRLARSAEALGFAFDRHAARNELQAATFGKKTAMMARLMLSPTGSMAIEIKPLPERASGRVKVAVRPLPVDPSDFRLRFKTTDRGFYQEARDDAVFETVFRGPDGRLTEGSFTNLFVERDGRLLTPPADRGLLPGVLRQKLLDEGQAIEADLIADDLRNGFFVGNMVRGLVPAELA